MGRARRGRPGGERDGHSDDVGFQHRRQHRRRLLPRQPEARPALVRRRRLPEARARPRQSPSRPASWSKRCCSRASARPASSSAERPAFRGSARGEVILSAGAVASPRVCQLSGVGPADWLTELGIPTNDEQPGVGRSLPDHLQQRAIFKVHGVRTLNGACNSLVGRGLMGAQYALFRKGPLTMAPSQLGIFTRSSPDHERANIQFHVQPLSLDEVRDPMHRFPAVTVSAFCNLQPTSRGTIRLRAPRSVGQANDRPNYLATPEDRRVARGRDPRHARRLMGQHALTSYRPQEFLPGPGGDLGDDDASLARAAGDIGTTISYTQIGTAKMSIPPTRWPWWTSSLRVSACKDCA